MFTLERSPVNVTSAGRRIVTRQSSFNIRELILEKSLTRADSVAKPSVRAELS